MQRTVWPDRPPPCRAQPKCGERGEGMVKHGDRVAVACAEHGRLCAARGMMFTPIPRWQR